MPNQGQQLKLDIDYLMMQQHIIAVHDGDDGYIAFCKIGVDGAFNQRHYLYDDLIRELELIDIDEDENYYFSVNSFYKPERRVENVRQIRALYADIDCHHLTPRQAARAIKNTLQHLNKPDVKKRIPTPSLMVKTGRGLQLYWLIEDLPKNAVPFWQLVQDALSARLAESTTNLDVTVDNVSDIARVLRLSGTQNTKTNTMATLIIQNTKLYRLDGLIADYFPKLSTLGKPRKKNAPARGKSDRVHYIFNLYSLHFARLNDLVKLQEMRKGQADSDECRRRMVFIYRYLSCCYLQDPVRALEDALAFNSTFTTPLPERTVIRETESAEKAYADWLSGEMVNINGQAYRKGYNYKNSTLIRWLGITPEEQREMQTIIGIEEKYRRNDKRRYGKDENGLTENQRQRMERDKQILAMHEQGMTYSEIGKILDIDKSTVCRAISRALHF